MTRRQLVKWLHWSAFFLILYFFVVEPDADDAIGAAAKSAGLSTHAGMGMVLAVVTVIWSGLFWRYGQLGRPGPKLPAWGKKAHGWLNRGLYWTLPVMVASGGLAGLLSEYPVAGFGVVPLNPSGWGNETLHELAEDLHELVFDAIILLIIAHSVFHVWRHVRLRDNALRIMAPKALHRYL